MWETPDGLSRELARVDGEFSAFQQEIKDAAFTRGYPQLVDAGLRPLVDLYLHSWIPLILRWQKFYAPLRGWSGRPFQWTHQSELDDLTAQLSDVRTAARGLMASTAPGPTSAASSASSTPMPPVSPPASPAISVAPASAIDAPWRPSYSSIELVPAFALGAIGVVAISLLVSSGRGRS